MGKLFRALASFVFVLGLIGGALMDLLCLLPLLLLALGVELVAMYILASIFVSPAGRLPSMLGQWPSSLRYSWWFLHSSTPGRRTIKTSCFDSCCCSNRCTLKQNTPEEMPGISSGVFCFILTLRFKFFKSLVGFQPVLGQGQQPAAIVR